MNLLYIVGPPAVGKSSLMARLTSGCDRYPENAPIGHDVLVDPLSGGVAGVELGRARPRFPGTDALPLNVSPAARAWLATGTAPRLILAEGDRLAHAAFLDAAAAARYRVTVAYLDASDETLDARCRARGSAQNLSWRRGRATKSRRLGDHALEHHTLLKLDGERDPLALVADLRAAMPALLDLPEPRA